MYNCAFYAKLSLCLFTYTNQLVSTQKILSRVCRALCKFAWQRVTPQAELLSWWIFFFCSPCVRSSFFSTNCFSATLLQRWGIFFIAFQTSSFKEITFDICFTKSRFASWSTKCISYLFSLHLSTVFPHYVIANWSLTLHQLK